MMVPMTVAGAVECVSQQPPFSWFQSQDFFQFLMLGLEDAGKTTLLYRIKIGVGAWKSGEIVKTMAHMKRDHQSGQSKDPSYHYEELRSSIGRYGFWEVPGNEVMMRMWPMFYRYLRITAVLFVVDAFSDDRENYDKIALARQQIRILLNEDELRVAAFVLILNTDVPEGAEKKQDDKEFEKALADMLGVPEIAEETAHKRRFLMVSMNCAEIHRESPVWEKLLKDIQKIYKNFGEGSL